MAKAQLNKSKLANIDSDFNPNTLVKTALFKVGKDKRIKTNNDLGIFLLNPESYEESKSSNWVAQSIPGQSDPTYQWISGGARTITFEALVTKETSQVTISQKVKSAGNALPPIVPKIVGKIGATIAGIASGPLANLATEGFSVTQETIAKEGVMDISAELNYYRSLLYPEYNKGKTQLIASPPLLALFTGSAFNRYKYGDSIGADTDLWVLTNLRIKHTKFLPNMSPMEAIVTFQLTQYTIQPFGSERFTNG